MEASMNVTLKLLNDIVSVGEDWLNTDDDETFNRDKLQRTSNDCLL